MLVLQVVFIMLTIIELPNIMYYLIYCHNLYGSAIFVFAIDVCSEWLQVFEKGTYVRKLVSKCICSVKSEVHSQKSYLILPKYRL